MFLMDLLIRRCRKGLPRELGAAARESGMEPDELARRIAAGRVVVPKNPARKHALCTIGEGCPVRINVNIGTSGSRCDPALEEKKAKAALENGADALMDLSTGGNLVAVRKKILKLDTTIGTVPVYEAVRRAGNAADVDADLLFRVIREHCRQGVDFLTLHCGVNRQALDALKADPRLMGVVSRGGSFHCAMMMQRDEENPLFSEYDYLLEILAEYDVTVSLGDGMRPGCLQDAGKLAKSVEYMTLGTLAKQALERGVQRMIEGPGHMPLDQVGYNVRMIKEITDHAPLYLLGPLVTDIAPGYDHVVGAIGGAEACLAGADFLCMVSPSEHLALPDVDDIIEGTRVAKIAAHIGDTVRKPGGWRAEREVAMATARHELDWDEQFRLALYGDHARKIHERDGETETCSMCGDLCAVKMVNELFGTAKKGKGKKKRDEKVNPG
ncbi:MULTISPECIES: phosphomethylpyrimidine synthase ThiC [unclassified Methanoregula]|uniref:phosphomethylpyrimidine synthase ThiC n=1 Tax=unclassified Methanoregula TaxID=2649730 RepID=UPI0009D00C73|nr:MULTISPECIES: phosphomethylpyrimidine synthase ThiC [unclassified Methanoregula]OPX63136.1 MAG: thiamine biosynthesis protein ThiC [Methanoregula sp. PtaB.Bin085]OPY33435.1 MAG: thiamine biosynthesis protein ThiC [Methanoregula sp. PtaU1.Bin006]